MELLSCQQLSERFPGSVRSWRVSLERWREEGKLEQYRHYKHGLVNGHYCLVYKLTRIVFLICSEARASDDRPFICRLYQEHYEEFCDILSAVTASKKARSG